MVYPSRGSMVAVALTVALTNAAVGQEAESLMGNTMTLSAGGVFFSEAVDNRSSLRLALSLDHFLEPNLYFTGGVDHLRIARGSAPNTVDPAVTMSGSRFRTGIGYELAHTAQTSVFGEVQTGLFASRLRESGGTGAHIETSYGHMGTLTAGIRYNHGAVYAGAEGEWAIYLFEAGLNRELTVSAAAGYEVTPGLIVSGLGQVITPTENTPDNIDTYVLGLSAEFKL